MGKNKGDAAPEPGGSTITPAQSASNRSTVRASVEAPLSSQEQRLDQYFNRHLSRIREVVSREVARHPFWPAERVQEVTDDLISQLFLEARRTSKQFNPQYGDGGDAAIGCWLLGIVFNLIRREKSAAYLQSQREVSVDGLGAALAERQLEKAMFDCFGQAYSPYVQPVACAEARALLVPVMERLEPQERQMLILAAQHGFDGKQIAAHFGISPVAARQRLSRARRHALQAYTEIYATDADEKSGVSPSQGEDS